MLQYIFYAPLNILCMLFCYLTNPVVCLFADEKGELPGIFKMWQTWDDTLNPRFYIKEKVPKFLRYNYDKHYEEYWDATPELAKLGRDRCFVKILDPHFTTVEKIKRYICRVMWLYRNCAYGFAFYCFGRKANGAKCERRTYEFDKEGHYKKYLTGKGNAVTRPWCFKSTWKINKKIRWEIYLGWKIDENVDKARQCMIANRVAIRFL